MKKEVLRKIFKVLMCLAIFITVLNFNVYATEPEILYTGDETIDTSDATGTASFKFKINQNGNKIYANDVKVTADNVTILNGNAGYGYNGTEDSYEYTSIFKTPALNTDVKVTIKIPYVDATTNDESEKTSTFTFKYKAPVTPIVKCNGSEDIGLKEVTSTVFSINVQPNGCELVASEIDISGNGIAVYDIDDGPQNSDGSYTRVANCITPEGGESFYINVEVKYTINGVSKVLNKPFFRKYVPLNVPEVICDAAEDGVYSSNVIEIVTYKNGWDIKSSQFSAKGAKIENVERVLTDSSQEYVAKITLQDLVPGDEYTIRAEIEYGTGTSNDFITKDFCVIYNVLGSSIGSPDDLTTLLNPNGNIGKIVYDVLKIVAAILTFVMVITVGINIILARHKADQRNNSMTGFLFIIVGIILLDVALILYSFFGSSIGNLSKQVGEVTENNDESSEDDNDGFGEPIVLENSQTENDATHSGGGRSFANIGGGGTGPNTMVNMIN